MEAVAAIGVAAAAMQFLDFSTKTLALCKQIRDSSTGSTETNAELTKSTKELKEMQKELRQAGNTPSSIYRKLLQAVKDCSLIADELLQLLKDFQELTRKSFGAVRSAFKVLKDSRKIEKLQKRLADCQEKFMTALTMDMREGVINLLEKQGILNDEIQNTIMPKLEQLEVQSAASHSATQSQLHTLAKDLKSSAGAIHTQLAANHVEQQASSKGILRGQKSIGKRINTRLDEASDRSQHHDFLESLYFHDMFARQQSIMPQSDGTYDWVLSGKSPPKAHSWPKRNIEHEAELRGRLLQWLQDERPVFWVNGKAGSGKSTLMLFIESDKRTETALKIWARTRKLYTFSFFFWRPGSSLQKSIVGLLRSILYQVTKAIPAVVSRIISNRPSLTHTDWTRAKLLDALKIAFSACQHDANGSVFLLIDGLDEFEGSYSELLDAVLGLQSGSNIKMCVSSRPEISFANKFASLPSISLQDLNYNDIQRYVATQFESLGDNKADLIEKVTCRAEGIFLWAALVCQSLVAGYEAEDDGETMAERLSTVPSGLEDLFNSMFSRIDQLHRNDLALYFALLRWNEKTPSYVTIALVTRMLYRAPFESIQQFVDACKTTHRSIVAQSKGLIQIVRAEYAATAHGWAFKDIATGHTRHQLLHEMDAVSMHECDRNVLQWVHRSAHDSAFDCIISDSSEFMTFDTLQLNQADFERQIVKAFTWLAQYTPVLIFARDHEILVPVFISSFTTLICSATSEIEDETFQALDTIHDAMQSSLCVTGEFVDCSVGSSELSSNGIDRTIVLNFWTSLARRDDYWTARFEQIKLSIHARLICCGLLERLHQVWFEEVFTEQRKSELGLLLAKFLLNEYSREAQGVCTKSVYARGGLYTCTWTSSGHPNEFKEVRCLLEVCSALKENASSGHHMQTGLPEDYRTALLAAFDARQLFVGEQVYTAQRKSRPLLLSLPWQHVVHSHETVFPSSFRRMRANLRLTFLTGKLSEAYECNCFDLSVRSSSYILQFRIAPPPSESDMVPELGGIAFAGTSQQREECLQMTIEEVWQNNDDQLDAWSQLYFLACVKTSFRDYWQIAASDGGSEAGEITDGTEVVS
ncbi:hypothetical protein Q7P36_009994 [Cladosporium allicinum]